MPQLILCVVFGEMREDKVRELQVIIRRWRSVAWGIVSALGDMLCGFSCSNGRFFCAVSNVVRHPIQLGEHRHCETVRLWFVSPSIGRAFLKLLVSTR